MHPHEGIGMASHRVLVVTGTGGRVSGALRRTSSVLISNVEALVVRAWSVRPLGWYGQDEDDRDLDQRIVEFVRQKGIQAVVAASVTCDLRHMLDALRIPVFERRGISACAAAVSAAAVLLFMESTARGASSTRRHAEWVCREE